VRAEINEIAQMLQGNLDKVVQHGKRPTRSSRTCCCTRVRAPGSASQSISTR
jgi:hypothetical protein